VTAPTLERPLTGYRWWVVKRRVLPWGWSIRASGSDTVWPSAQLEARCLDPTTRHAAPSRSCRCGLYAVDSVATAERYRRSHHGWRARLAGEEVVLGAVHLWSAPGRPVIVGELRGRPGFQFRAPFARIVALADSPAARRVGPELQVPVVRPDYLEAFAREMGGEELLPPQPRPAPAPTPRPGRDQVRRPEPGPGLLPRVVGRLRRPRRPSTEPVEAVPAEPWASRLQGWAGRRRPATSAVAGGLAVLVAELLSVCLLHVLWSVLLTALRTERALLWRSWRHGLIAGVAGWVLGLSVPVTVAVHLAPVILHLVHRGVG